MLPMHKDDIQFPRGAPHATASREGTGDHWLIRPSPEEVILINIISDAAERRGLLRALDIAQGLGADAVVAALQEEIAARCEQPAPERKGASESAPEPQ